MSVAIAFMFMIINIIFGIMADEGSAEQISCYAGVHLSMVATCISIAILEK